MKQKLNVIDVITNGTLLGVKNFLPLLLTCLLWILTCWIPYLNVGTTIAMATIPLQLSKGQTIRPTGIFDEKYRQFMGEYLLTLALRNMIIGAGMAFLIIPGIVMAISYMFAPLMVIDKGMNPTEALTASNKLTHGNKWMIFFSMLAFFIVFIIVASIPLIGIIMLVLFLPLVLSVIGYIYGKLSQFQLTA